MIKELQASTEEFYIIKSRLTGRPYIDKARQAYVFTTKGRAQEMFGWMETVTIELPPAFNAKQTISDCYAAGAESIVIRRQTGQEIYTIDESVLERRFYNGKLNADIALLMHTKDKQYLRNMEDCKFIIPVKITNYPDVRIVYATVVLKDKPYMYLAFTDLDEYNKWSGLVKGWKALSVDAYDLIRIGKKHGYMVNVCGFKLIITGRTLKQLEVGEDDGN